jgi:hypothetical protein
MPCAVPEDFSTKRLCRPHWECRSTRLRNRTRVNSFKWGEHYPIFKDIELTIGILFFYNGVFSYKIDTDTLYMLECVGGEIEPAPLYCKKR